MIVVSKIGYVQGRILCRCRLAKNPGKPYPEMVKYGDDIWHCIHPEFSGRSTDAVIRSARVGHVGRLSAP